MSTPTESASNLAATAAQTALQTAANDVFIAEATKVIAEAVAQGQFLTYVYSIPGMNFQTIYTYFQALGYVIGNPAAQITQLGPAALFGQFWVNYWANVSPIIPPNQPIRLFIAWSQPG